jgi:soluble lytic murein transglycosylase-like protein
MKKIVIIPLLILLLNFESRASLSTNIKSSKTKMICQNKYSHLVIKYAERYNIKSDIMLSLCKQENSRYSARIVNSHGAVGIMQVKPIAFREIMRIMRKDEYLDTR